jgi:hypothetical protein
VVSANGSRRRATAVRFILTGIIGHAPAFATDQKIVIPALRRDPSVETANPTYRQWIAAQGRDDTENVG